MSPTDQELLDGEADHDCRERVQSGHAKRVDVYTDAPHQVQIKHECDVCGRAVYLICEAFNIQIKQNGDSDLPGSVIEPDPDVNREDIYTSDKLGAA